ncbi:MAG: hypothetical protein ABSH22_17670, partial [Tepidisphaeraceae bacterium]
MKFRRLALIGFTAALAAPVALVVLAYNGPLARAADDMSPVAMAAPSDAPLAAPADSPATQPTADPEAQRQAALKEFDLGEQARKVGQPADAISHYKAVIDNRYADDATVRQATDALAAAQADLAKQGGAAPLAALPPAVPVVAPLPDPQLQTYNQAVADIRAGKLDDAKQILQPLADANYQPPIFHRTPKELLEEIQLRTGPATASPVVLAAATPAADTTAPTPEAPAPAPATTAPAAPIAAAPTTEPTALDRLQAQAANEKLAQEQRQFHARGLVDLARQAYAQGDKTEALRDYIAAADLDPSNQDAQAGKAQLQAETGTNPPPPASSQFRNQLEVEIQDIQFRFNTAIRDAKAAIAANDYDTAQRRLEDARVARSMDPGVFPVEQIREMDATIAQVDQEMKDAKSIYDQRANQATQNEVEAREKARLDQVRAERERTIANLIQLARQDTDAENYAAALGVLDQILVLDPRNDYAIGVRPYVEDRAIVQEQRKYREQYDLQYAKQLNAADEKLIPYDDIIRYPSNWPDISESRDQEVKDERGLTREDQAAEALLDKVLPEKAIDYLRDTTGANVFVNTRALEAAGVDRSTPITLKLNNVKFSKALSTILAMVGGQTKLGYDIDEGVITISTADELNQTVDTQVYDIRDLLVTNPMFSAQDVQNVLSSLGSGGGGSQTFGSTGTGGGLSAPTGGSSGLSNSSSSSFSSGNSRTTQNNNTNQTTMAGVVKLITDTVATDTWKTNGGTVGAISQLVDQGQIVVTQTPENQRKLLDLLDKIREKRDIMVTIEVRFLTVNRNFIETVGLNLDATFNTNQQPNSVFSTIPVHILDTGFTQGTSGITTGVPGSIGSGATPSSASFTYLDDFQVNVMLQAVEAAANSSIVNAPRLSTYDGIQAELAVGTQFDYVSNLTPVVGSGGSVGYTATVSTTSAGIELSVTPIVSADRKYVTLTITTQLSLPPVLTPFNLTTPASQSTSVSGT